MQRPVTAPPRHPSTTPLRHWSIIPQLKLPRATTPSRYRSTTRKRTSHPTTPGPKYYSVSSYYTEASANYSTKTVEYYTESPKYYSAPIYTTTTEAAKYYDVPTYYTEAALSCHVEQKYYTDAPVHYTTTYATPQPPSTTPKKPPITQQRMLPSLLHRGSQVLHH